MKTQPIMTEQERKHLKELLVHLHGVREGTEEYERQIELQDKPTKKITRIH